jgi:general stress protein 26
MDPAAGREPPSVAEFRRMIDGIPVVMVTTVADDDLFRSRPMLLERLEDDGSLVLLTHLSSQKVHELQRDPRVNVTFVDDKGTRYVYATGRGRVARDQQSVDQFWKPTYRAWFPSGRHDPEIAVLTIDVERVEYWDVPSSRLVRLWSAVRALTTGNVIESGEHHTVTFRNT